MAYGKVKHSRKKVAKRATEIREMKRLHIGVSVDRKMSGAFYARACVQRKHSMPGNNFVPTKRGSRDRCEWGAPALSPTAAVKKALHKLASKLK